MSDTSESTDGAPLLSHVYDLIASLKLFLIFLGIGMGLGYIFSEPLVSWMTNPYKEVMGADAKLIYLSPFEKVWVHMRVAMWGGVFAMFPALFWSLFRFVSPALELKTHKAILRMIFIFWVVLIGGLYIGQKYSVPILLKALTHFKGFNEAPFIALDPYIGMTLGALIATALLFELPLLMFYFSHFGWVSSRRWSESRKIALVLNALVSAILSPPDALSMIILIIPIHILYEFGILLAKLANRKHSKTEPTILEQT